MLKILPTCDSYLWAVVSLTSVLLCQLLGKCDGFSPSDRKSPVLLSNCPPLWFSHHQVTHEETFLMRRAIQARLLLENKACSSIPLFHLGVPSHHLFENTCCCALQLMLNFIVHTCQVRETLWTNTGFGLDWPCRSPCLSSDHPYVSWCKWLNFYQPHFLNLQNRNNNSTCLTVLFPRLKRYFRAEDGSKS